MASVALYEIIFKKLIFCMCLWAANCIVNDLSRNERALIYPPYTVLQFAVGLAVPAQVPNRTIFTNLGVLSNIPLPSKVEQFYPHVKRKARHQLITHAHLFEFFEKTSFFKGDAEQCVLKTICQVSQIKNEEENLLTKLFYVLFLLSDTKHAVSEKHYFIAEQNGRRKNSNCSQMYPACHASILDFVGHVD